MSKIVLKGGVIIDKSGERKADVAIGQDGLISEIGEGLSAENTIDVKGQIISSGFVDLNAHFSQPGNEKSEIAPRTPYGISKAAGFWLIKFYRNYHNIFCSCGILFNHESPLRSKNFVFKKIVNESKKIKKIGGKISLGNIKIKRDIGWAPDYVVAMWKMLQLKKPIDLVIGSGKKYSIEEFLNLTLKSLNINKKKVLINKKELIRKIDIKEYKSDPKLAKKKIKWKNQLSLNQIVRKMINNEYF